MARREVAKVKVSVHGLGKLGLPFACVLAEAGHKVIGTDVNAETIKSIDNGETPFFEPGLDTLLTSGNVQRNLEVTEFCHVAVDDTDVHFVVVPTPSGAGGFFTNKYVLEAVTEIGKNFHRPGHTIVVVSTVMPGSGDNEIIPAIEKASGYFVNQDFHYVYNPEFIALGTVISDMHNPDFLLVGASDAGAAKSWSHATYGVAAPHTPVQVMSVVNAEIAKISLNSYVTMKISYANQLAELCENIPGADAAVVTHAIGHDRRIGHKCLKPATPYGGPCFPRDSVAFGALMESIGLIAELAEATDSINKRQLKRAVNIVQMHCSKQERIVVMGLSYKEGTPITEQAFGTKLYQYLLREKFNVSAYDPMVQPDTNWEGARTYIITTPEPEFAYMDFGNAKVIDYWGIATTGDIKRAGTNALFL